MIKKIWVVSWARALGGDEIKADAYAGTEGAYTSFGDALKALTKCKDELISGIYEGIEDPEDKELEIQVYGSEHEEYYEINYTTPDDTLIEFYIGLQEVNLYGFAENEAL
jgi:flavin-dependent dehydrogenase